jgi:4-hydroxy-3-polyprenylbenzoate decarboxylase
MNRLVVGITGASGSLYARQLIEILSDHDVQVHLVPSGNAMKVIPIELEPLKSVTGGGKDEISDYFQCENLTVHDWQDFTAPIASGSYRTDGMVVCPCTAGTLGRIANGISSNLLERAADVTLKEGRKLVCVFRETPYSGIMIENMLKLSRAGGVILPASPAFYRRPETIMDLVDTVVSRILDHMGVESELGVRWPPD